MVSARLVAMAVNPSKGASDDDDELLEAGVLVELADELDNEEDALFFPPLSSPPQPTRPAPIKAATAVLRLPFRNWRRWVSTSAKVVLEEVFDIDSIPELSIS